MWLFVTIYKNILQILFQLNWKDHICIEQIMMLKMKFLYTIRHLKNNKIFTEWLLMEHKVFILLCDVIWFKCFVWPNNYCMIWVMITMCYIFTKGRLSTAYNFTADLFIIYISLLQKNMHTSSESSGGSEDENEQERESELRSRSRFLMAKKDTYGYTFGE